MIPYDDAKLSDGNVGEIVSGSNMQDEIGRKLILTDKKYKCPQCNQMTLCFDECGMWD